MKNNIYIIGLLVFMLFSSCQDDFLDEELLSSYDPTELNDELGLDAALIGIQNQYSIWQTFAYDYASAGGQGWLGVWQIGTDVAYNKAPADFDPWTVPYTNYENLTPTDPAVLFTWVWGYKIINNANSIIAAIGNPETVLEPAAKAKIEGEAKFYRGLAYNTLVTLFGRVPMITATVDGPKTDFEKASLDELNTLIEDDLTFARNNLPTVNNVDGNSKGKMYSRAHVAMAEQVLAEAYLRMGKNDLAEATCNAIIDSGDFSLVTQRYGVKASQPGDPFSDMFIYGNQRRSQGNTEAIWVLEIENPASVIGGSGEFSVGLDSYLIGSPQHRRVWGSRYHQQAGMVLADSLGGRGISRIALTDWVLDDLYAVDDMRNSKYNLRRDYYYNDPDFALFGQKVDITDPNVNTQRFIVPVTTKWNQFDANDPFGFAMIKDIIIMRLGETYLLKAEAQFKQGKLAEAAATINVLRNRANATPVAAGDITLDFILDERARELLAEENRRMTLMRTGQLVNRVGVRGQKITGISNTHLLLPIPQSEIDLNKDAVLEQNPGYN
ncbi:RagB/SusD family nutrient uptake outer membrane protein [Oceanihabitans sp. IOP_32]|uniref:RagB/SusD family nutrient uptake outer membrane protein n=1 Tax=Oceanihabitans sp. IOP_32 TaxID=2529032 RepID=UPI0012940EB9|nr:RagB/SusD family nutrient uptake outer membrane protein [Oceanihabitans sp. IOP_32]QFZ54100.1 RagB/SusD family nutrient uptake outer membrane protein [Oceanihabitans sp. IOP_32]